MKVDLKKQKDRRVKLEKKLYEVFQEFLEVREDYERVRNRYYYLKRKVDKIELEVLRLRQGQFNFADLQHIKETSEVSSSENS